MDSAGQHRDSRHASPFDELNDALPEGWDGDRLNKLVVYLACQREPRAGRMLAEPLSEQEEVIAVLASKLQKSGYALRSAFKTIKRRTIYIEHLTGEPYSGIPEELREPSGS